MGKAFWCLVYAVICLLEFLICWAKEAVDEKIKGAPPKDKDADKNASFSSWSL